MNTIGLAILALGLVVSADLQIHGVGQRLGLYIAAAIAGVATVVSAFV